MKFLFTGTLILSVLYGFTQNPDKIEVHPIPLDPIRPVRYARSCADMNGDIHVPGLFKVIKLDEGQIITQAQYEPVFPPTSLNEAIMNTFFLEPRCFIALSNRLEPESGATYSTKMWRSNDNLKTITQTEAKFIIREAGNVNFGSKNDWAGLFCHRAIIKLLDGSFLASMYGNFEYDTNPTLVLYQPDLELYQIKIPAH